MNLILFWTYILTIIVLVIVILIIILVWGDYFPRRWLLLLKIFFIGLIGGLIVLLTSESLAPYNSHFYLNPFLFILYIGLIGCSMFAVYLTVIEIHFKHIRLLLVLGYIGFFMEILLLITSAILFLMVAFSRYPLITYISFELMYGLGILAYILLAIGNFTHISSDRLEKKHRVWLIIVGICSLGIAYGLTIMAWGTLYIDYSVAFDPLNTIFWLIWICSVSIVYLFLVKRAVKIFT